MDANGSNNRRITQPTEDVWAAACSPDGKKIAYVVLNGNGQGKLRLMNPDGSEGSDLTGWYGSRNFKKATWSSDSRQIAFDGYSPDGYDRIGVVNADGSGLRRLFTNNQGCYSPSWSPDGKFVAFSSFAQVSGNYFSKIFLFNAQNHQVTQLTTAETFDYDPTWSSDSKTIIYTSAQPGISVPSHLFLVKIDGTGMEQLTSGPGSDGNAFWFK